MTTLRIKQTTEITGAYRIELTLEGNGLAPQNAFASFSFEMSPQDQEDLRWYLEDYLQFPHDPAPAIAARTEQRMTEIGIELFQAVFDSSTQATRLWAKVYERVSDMRIEIVTSVREAGAIPWELLRDPHTDVVLALRAAAFVRTHQEAAFTPKPLVATSGPIRILLVICRPKQGDDVPFRSVASRLVKSLTDDSRSVFQLDVLRPPTYDQFAKTLRKAKRDGQPYHVVHFDGHGMYAEFSNDDGSEAAAAWLKSMIPLILSGPREGSHGYLLFENPISDQNLQFVDGDSLGKLLYETNTPVLVLNACRSAHLDVANQPEPAASSDEMHAQIRAFGSLAQEVIDAGVTGVVAMRYNVYVVTAAQFVADLYAALVQGNTLGGAVTLGRKQLRDNLDRTIDFAARQLQDWCVPLVYEAIPTVLFDPKTERQPLSIKVGAGGSLEAMGSLDRTLTPPPDVGFFGRDETLLALDRAFDVERIVLLHAYAGSGKTATAAEFARWYSLTGGVAGPVLFTSFEQHRPLPRVLDRVGEVFGSILEQSGVNWLALDDGVRRDVALEVLNQIPVVWIWDNVESVAGFPDGTKSEWSDDEQKKLVDFLRDAAQTKAKFLLTSRREEREWLGDNLPCRVPIPPMPMLERVQFTQAIAQRQKRKMTDVADWWPLLEFTDGNPLTITVLVGQALRDGLKTRDQIEAFVEKLRSGEAVFKDDIDEGRDRSLTASLSYGFEHAFDKGQHRVLALLHFFQGFVDVRVLHAMGRSDADWCLPTMRGLPREAGIQLLDRAAEVGLLTSFGGGYYTIHPALPWFFKRLFDEYFSNSENLQLLAKRAFVEAMGDLGCHYHRQYNKGIRDIISVLFYEEANLRHAYRMARSNGWWDAVIATMQGLHTLFQCAGRKGEWRSLVDEVLPDFLDLKTDQPLPGREKQWLTITKYRADLARDARKWNEANHLLLLIIEFQRAELKNALSEPIEALSEKERGGIDTLGAALTSLGQMRLSLDIQESLDNFHEAFKLAKKINDSSRAAICAFNLGNAYSRFASSRNLEQAENWFQHSLHLRIKDDNLGRARCLHSLGVLKLTRFQMALADHFRDSTEPVDLRTQQFHRNWNGALNYLNQAMKLIPSEAVVDLALTHTALGSLYTEINDIDSALRHYNYAIRYQEVTGDFYEAGAIRANMAITLVQSGRLIDAREYALAALRNYHTYGDAVATEVQEMHNVITYIEQFTNQQSK
ncbi:CHAT domain protein [Gimesia panareensis]|uniref:CHAT domain protein n=1 Tax=Gimesia panareensis TaxID=2527978 RepID=A0A517Q0H8_9PLAN|nr:CHAT domain-containing protein [Gimesia panareensis]QDT25131.1 CHAT domain protein [Gimesia panareensis]